MIENSDAMEVYFICVFMVNFVFFFFVIVSTLLTVFLLIRVEWQFGIFKCIYIVNSLFWCIDFQVNDTFFTQYFILLS